jgi:eukaryotic-like serine/threonine-protein kinase
VQTDGWRLPEGRGEGQAIIEGLSRRFQPDEPPRMVGRYALFHELASGGMATVHLGRLQATAGFSRTVAVKRLHAQHAKDPDFVAMFMDEARLAARINHPNVVATLDVVVEDDELFLVMDYVHGESLARLIRNTAAAGRQVPVAVAVSIVIGMLHGLHAAHEAKSENGEPLDIVHRDMSPQNVIVGADGVARVLDFGVAKAANRAQTTQDGQLKGKLRYMSPEQLHSHPVTRSSDIFSAAIVAWELLTCQRFISVDEPGAIIMKLLSDETPRPSSRRKDLDWVADEVLLRGLRRDPLARYATALEFAVAFEKMGPAPLAEVSEWVKWAAAEALAERAALVRQTESRTPTTIPLLAPPSSVPRERGGDIEATAVDRPRARTSQPHPEVAPADIVQTQLLPRHSQPVSQLSSISVTASVVTPPTATLTRQRLLVLVAVLGLLVVSMGVAVVVLRARAHTKELARAAAPAPTTAAPLVPSLAPPPPPPSADVAPRNAPDASVSAPVRPPGARPPRRPPPRTGPTSEPSDIILQR